MFCQTCQDESFAISHLLPVPVARSSSPPVDEERATDGRPRESFSAVSVAGARLPAREIRGESVSVAVPRLPVREMRPA